MGQINTHTNFGQKSSRKMTLVKPRRRLVGTIKMSHINRELEYGINLLEPG